MVACCCLKTECPVCCAVPVSTLPCNPCLINNATSAQKGKDKKKAKYDSLQELRKNKKELEFEQKLYKEKEEMLEKEKQLKINRLAQEVCVLLPGLVSFPGAVWLVPTMLSGNQMELLFPNAVQGWSEPGLLPRLESDSFLPTQSHLRLASGLVYVWDRDGPACSGAGLSTQIVGLGLASTHVARDLSLSSTPTTPNQSMSPRLGRSTLRVAVRLPSLLRV